MTDERAEKLNCKTSKTYLAARMAFLLSADAGRLNRSALFCNLCWRRFEITFCCWDFMVNLTCCYGAFNAKHVCNILLVVFESTGSTHKHIQTRHTYFTGGWWRIYFHHVLFSRPGKKFQISKDAIPPPLSSFHIVQKFVDQSNNTHVWTGDSESLSTFTLLSLSTLAKSWKERETADKPNVVGERKQHERP